MNWIKFKDKKPTEADGMILVCSEGKSYVEIVYVSDEEQRFKKPFAYDEYDGPVWDFASATHWMKIIRPDELIEAQEPKAGS